MTLLLILLACSTPTSSAPTGSTATAYTCSMHHEVHTDAPGKCPKCGMDLVPASEVTP